MVAAADVLSMLLTLLSSALQGIPLCPNESTTTDIYVTTSGNLTFCDLPCKAEGDYNVDHRSSMVFTYFCQNQSLHVYGRYKIRTTLDKTCGCVTVSKAKCEDAGTYFIYYIDKNQRKTPYNTQDCHVMAPISINNISKTILGENSSLTVFYTGDEPAIVIWSRIGGELPEDHLLTNHNKTLIVPSTATGVYRVVVSNRASKDVQEYTMPSRGPHHTKVGIILGIIIPGLFVIVMALVIYKKCKNKKEGRP
ncbi:uncharacterized protein LOC122922234 [Bufo gargarizans]|uniref:uncharacterized protein LOC122922234 n=1 Tax=Bufo gargarizans TaxID=30331 RepID=UPI001CF2C5A9|nr:uncharacterized protein LOC122922234 [Bufo gargarizans]